MRKSIARALVPFTLVGLLAGSANAEEPSAPVAPEAAPAAVEPTPQAAPAPTPAPGAPVATLESTPKRRDPKGVTGISPFTEALLRGDAAYLARDFVGAEREYRAAVEASPQDAQGHLRLAAVMAQQARLEEAMSFAEAAARFAGPDAKLRSDALRFAAFALEAGGAIERAIAGWKLFAIEDARVPRKTPTEDIAEGHVARLEARQKMIEQGLAVKEKVKKELDGTAQSGASAPSSSSPK
jgi:tetratricopeptide (TPR) repeat protein